LTRERVIRPQLLLRGVCHNKINKALVASMIVPLILVLEATAASATTCSSTGGDSVDGNPGHYYGPAQLTNSFNYGGIESYLSVDGLSRNGATFQIAWVGGHTGTGSGCVNKTLHGDCSIQAGYGWGVVGGYNSASYCSGLCGYMEEEDVSNYVVNWNPSNVSLTQDDFVNSYYTGTASNGNGLWDAYIQPQGHSAILAGQAWFHTYYEYAQVAGEAETSYTSSNVTCAAENAYEYFGTDGHGNTYSWSEAEVSLNGANWTPWANNGDAKDFANAPYSTTYVSQSTTADSYKGSGS
jgi:hypothetical protein